ncbi:hypothetical protein L210DRAFT_3544079 [Boletus edulis BED1]|uniref:Uncharacterized protein n=1 Tax=Boletus edulis BED1 TaxID=1328754 RepID=A0AAD4BRN0_BOLED|nr:hypothetical protein L210DRAFT_3544079 [Boletus edulis BED1]
MGRAREEPPGVPRGERSDALGSRAGESFEAFRARFGGCTVFCVCPESQLGLRSRLRLRWCRE